MRRYVRAESSGVHRGAAFALACDTAKALNAWLREFVRQETTMGSVDGVAIRVSHG
jgi:hypothetical protein